jgi:hypothetical protein
MEDALEGDAGIFRRPWGAAHAGAHETTNGDATHTGFSVGVAATGNVPNIAGRLFRHEFAEDIWRQLRDRPMGLPAGFGSTPDAVEWSQEALTWRHQIVGPLATITVVRATWDGSAAVGQKLPTEDFYPDSFAQNRVAPEWRLADELVKRLGGFGEFYVTVLAAGGRFPRHTDTGSIVIRRGPLLSGVDDERVATLSRELMRAVGNPEPEP